MQVPFFTFRDFPTGLQDQIESALVKESRRNQFILGTAVTKFEHSFSEYLGGTEVVGVGNGYDALSISLRALGVGPGDEVVVPSNGYIATINAVQQVGATPVFAEPEAQTFNITAATVLPVISARTKAILPIHLYGQPCQMKELLTLCTDKGLELVEDFAQAHGARYKGQTVGTFGKINATSFYPTKNLGALGDGGAVTTFDPQLANWVRQYHNYGQSEKYQYAMAGINSRLDSVQAEVLSVKLQHLNSLNQERQRLAQVYLQTLRGVGDLLLPVIPEPDMEHVYHLFVIRTHFRDALQQYLKEQGISTLVHYPVPPHLQPAYQNLGHQKGSFPVAEELAKTSLSLPLFPGMTEQEQQFVIEQINAFFEKV
ncbi:DegT/DnrJ/EryC1/StrS family aminotransferase [Rufibacter roseus]|uniref:DegT/DnrJ/EryC1/StrS family aminotransferase n=1 Tax=Rufibacter roseus TaxID=1567108 RepID=A0ABW2DMR7_9BACT|nr:DegT/DnrJ/EryC1/StrS family aminotransferase [Rufibacter roseus]